MIFQRAAAVALLTCSLGVSAHAGTFYPVSATGSSSYPGYPDSDAIDPGGANSDWAAFSSGAGSYLNLDLGKVYALTGAEVTDRVTSGGGNNVFFGGLYDFTTRFELQSFTDATFTTPVGAGLFFDHAAPAVHNAPSDFEITVPVGLTTQYLRYTVVTTNGVNPGLSDLQFTGTAVPEPAAWALMLAGFGLAGGALRASRQRSAAA